MSDKIRVEVVKGPEGLAVYIADCRVCGTKPMGGGTVIGHWEVDVKDIKYGLAHVIDQAVQPRDLDNFCDSLCPLTPGGK